MTLVVGGEPGRSLERLPDLEAVRAERAVRSLYEYIKHAWSVLEPATPYIDNWHIGAISEYLEAVTAGEILRLLINIPPRYMKSTCVTVSWPTWRWASKPESRWLFTSYSQDLATQHSVDRRRIIESEWYQRRWGYRFKMTTDQNVKNEYENDKRGRMYSFGMRGTATGKGGDIVVVDDPHNPKQAESDVQRQGAITIFDRTLQTRLDDKKRGAIVVVMQRLHERDLAAHCIELGYTHLCLPAEAEARTVVAMPRSGKEVVRERGDLLWPEREGPTEIAAMKVALGSYGYAGQYQQSPSPAEGGMLKRKWWRFWYRPDEPQPPVVEVMPDGSLHEYGQVELPDKWEQQLQSWDMTFKDTKGSDYVAGQVWGKRGANCFLLDYLLERLDFPDTVQAVVSMSARWPRATAKLVEDKANGPAVIATLRNKLGGLIAVEPQGGKAARVSAVSPLIEAGNVILPHPNLAPWVRDFIELCARFPNGRIDDPIDALSQALLRLGPGAGRLVILT